MDTERRLLGIKLDLRMGQHLQKRLPDSASGVALPRAQVRPFIDKLNFHCTLANQPITLHGTTADASVIAMSVDVGVRRSGYRSKIITLELDPVFPKSHPPGPEIQ